MTVRTFVRWRAGEPREQRIFAPLEMSHPMAAAPCSACGSLLGDGRSVQLLAIGPSDDEDREAHASGNWYSAVAIVLHADCLGMTPNAAEATAVQP